MRHRISQILCQLFYYSRYCGSKVKYFSNPTAASTTVKKTGRARRKKSRHVLDLNSRRPTSDILLCRASVLINSAVEVHKVI